MKTKVYEVITFSFEMVFYLVFAILSIMFIWSSISNIIFSERVKEFIDSAEYECEENNIIYYTVEDGNLDEDTITKKPSENNIHFSPILGAPGDIFLMPQSRMEYFPFFSSFVTYLFGGHAGVISNDEKIIESMGGSEEEGYVFLNDTDLFSEERTVIGLRVNASQEDRKKALNSALGLVGRRYNYWFILNTEDKYYCMDICSRIYDTEFNLDYNLDRNGFHTTINDLLFSKDTKISFVKYKHNGKTYIYYLK